MTGRLLVRGRLIVTEATEPVRDDAALAIDDGVVVDVGRWADLRARYAGWPVIGSADHAVVPGLINAHHHSHAVTLTQHGLPEAPLETYLMGLSAVRQCDRELDALLCGARLLATGVTSAVDLFTGGGRPEDFTRDLRALQRGYDRAGLRVALAAGIGTHGGLVYGQGQDEAFLAGLPTELARQARRFVAGAATIGEDDYFAAMEEVAGDPRNPARSWLWYSFPGPEWVGDNFMERIGEAARARDANIQTHALETLAAKVEASRTDPSGGVRHLDRLGLLGPRFSMAHGVWLTQSEIDLLAGRGAAVVHNPGSNLRLGAGIAPLNAMHRAGLPLALGMDGTTLHNDEDMFAEMRLALRLQREPAMLTDAALTPRQVLALATSGGARLMNAENRLGKLLPGYDADLVLIDLSRIAWPWVAPEADLLDVVLLRASPADIEAVLVAGEVVFRDGQPTRFDLEAAVSELAEQAAAASFPRDRADVVHALTPHLLAWYAARPKPQLEPWSVYHSH